MTTGYLDEKHTLQYMAQCEREFEMLINYTVHAVPRPIANVTKSAMRTILGNVSMFRTTRNDTYVATENKERMRLVNVSTGLPLSPKEQRKRAQKASRSYDEMLLRLPYVLQENGYTDSDMNEMCGYFFTFTPPVCDYTYAPKLSHVMVQAVADFRKVIKRREDAPTKDNFLYDDLANDITLVGGATHFEMAVHEENFATGTRINVLRPHVHMATLLSGYLDVDACKDELFDIWVTCYQKALQDADLDGVRALQTLSSDCFDIRGVEDDDMEFNEVVENTLKPCLKYSVKPMLYKVFTEAIDDNVLPRKYVCDVFGTLHESFENIKTRALFGQLLTAKKAHSCEVKDGLDMMISRALREGNAHTMLYTRQVVLETRAFSDKMRNVGEKALSNEEFLYHNRDFIKNMYVAQKVITSLKRAMVNNPMIMSQSRDYERVYFNMLLKFEKAFVGGLGDVSQCVNGLLARVQISERILTSEVEKLNEIIEIEAENGVVSADLLQKAVDLRKNLRAKQSIGKGYAKYLSVLEDGAHMDSGGSYFIVDSDAIMTPILDNKRTYIDNVLRSHVERRVKAIPYLPQNEVNERIESQMHVHYVMNGVSSNFYSVLSHAEQIKPIFDTPKDTRWAEKVRFERKLARFVGTDEHLKHELELIEKNFMASYTTLDTNAHGTAPVQYLEFLAGGYMLADFFGQTGAFGYGQVLRLYAQSMSSNELATVQAINDEYTMCKARYELAKRFGRTKLMCACRKQMMSIITQLFVDAYGNTYDVIGCLQGTPFGKPTARNVLRDLLDKEEAENKHYADLFATMLYVMD